MSLEAVLQQTKRRLALLKRLRRQEHGLPTVHARLLSFQKRIKPLLLIRYLIIFINYIFVLITIKKSLFASHKTLAGII